MKKANPKYNQIQRDIKFANIRLKAAENQLVTLELQANQLGKIIEKVIDARLKASDDRHENLGDIERLESQLEQTSQYLTGEPS